MKLFILAAGLGTRLQSLGLDLPKVMVPIGGQPLLQHHLELCRRQGITDIIINLHYLPEKITEYFGDGSAYDVAITYSHEAELLGTAGAVKKMEEHLRDGPFILMYGDNLVSIDFSQLLRFHRDHQAMATIALFESPEPWTGGVVETDPDGRVERFVEKPNPDEIRTNLINAGIYVLEPQVLDLIPPAKFCDFGRDVFPGMLASGQPIYAMEPEAYIWDVGTPERLKKAQADYQAGKLTVGGMEKR